VTGTGQPAAYMPPEIGFDTLKDAAALIRCILDGDTAGIGAILDGTPTPRELAGMAATVAGTICLRGGLSPAQSGALVDAIASDLGNQLLDQQPGPVPVRTADVGPGPADLPYDPAQSLDVMADVSALVLACISGDGQGAIAVADHSAAPRQVAAVLAAMLVSVCRTAGMDDCAIEASARQLGTSADDAVTGRHQREATSDA